jgi:hypothetical protein
MERKRDKRLEAAGAVLKISQSQEMVDPMVRLFDVSVQHRAVGFEPDFVSRLMDLDPLVGICFVFANLASDFGVEDFRSATRHASQPGLAQIIENLFRRPLC